MKRTGLKKYEYADVAAYARQREERKLFEVTTQYMKEQYVEIGEKDGNCSGRRTLMENMKNTSK